MPRSKVVHPHSFFPDGWSPEAPLLGVPFSFNTRFQKRLKDVGVIWGNDFVVDREPSQPTLADGGDTKKVEFKFKSDDAYQKALAIYNDMFGDDDMMYENVISDEEVLKEFNYRSIVPKLYHKTMSALGSNKAGGRLQLSQTTDQLMGEFNTFLGHQGGKPTWANILAFLTQKFGEQTAVELGKTLANPGAQQQAQAQEQQPQSAAPAGATPETPAAAPAQKLKNPKLNGMYNNAAYRQTTVKQLNDLIAQPNPDAKQIMNLVRGLYKHAQENGGQDKASVAAYLNSLRTNPKVFSNPALAQIFRNIKTESVNRVLDMAIYLVENNIVTKQGLTEAYSKFFLTEAPFGKRIDPNSTRPAYDNGVDNPSFGSRPDQPQPAQPSAEPAEQQSTTPPNPIYSRKQLVKMFQLIAKGLLANGQVDFPSGNDNTYYRKGANGRYQAVTEPSAGKTAMAGKTNAAPTAASKTPSLDINLLKANMAKRNVGPDDQRYILDMIGRRNYSWKQVEQAYRDKRKEVPPNIASAIAATLLGH